MKNKIFRSLALLFVAVFSTAAVMAQPGHNKDYNGRGDDDRDDRYDDRRYDRDDDRRDKDGRYDHGDYNRNRDYSHQIRHRPSEPRYVQSRRPSPNHVWIPGDWVYNRGEYSYHQGYWAMPSGGQVYVPGRWEKVHRGWYWVPGYWTRVNRHW